MYWQANANTPLSVTPLLNVPYFSCGGAPNFTDKLFCGHLLSFSDSYVFALDLARRT